MAAHVRQRQLDRDGRETSLNERERRFGASTYSRDAEKTCGRKRPLHISGNEAEQRHSRPRDYHESPHASSSSHYRRSRYDQHLPYHTPNALHQPNSRGDDRSRTTSQGPSDRTDRHHHHQRISYHESRSNGGRNRRDADGRQRRSHSRSNSSRRFSDNDSATSPRSPPNRTSSFHTTTPSPSSSSHRGKVSPGYRSRGGGRHSTPVVHESRYRSSESGRSSSGQRSRSSRSRHGERSKSQERHGSGGSAKASAFRGIVANGPRLPNLHANSRPSLKSRWVPPSKNKRKVEPQPTLERHESGEICEQPNDDEERIREPNGHAEQKNLASLSMSGSETVKHEVRRTPPEARSSKHELEGKGAPATVNRLRGFSRNGAADATQNNSRNDLNKQVDRLKLENARDSANQRKPKLESANITNIGVRKGTKSHGERRNKRNLSDQQLENKTVWQGVVQLSSSTRERAEVVMTEALEEESGSDPFALKTSQTKELPTPELTETSFSDQSKNETLQSVASVGSMTMRNSPMVTGLCLTKPSPPNPGKEIVVSTKEADAALTSDESDSSSDGSDTETDEEEIMRWAQKMFGITPPPQGQPQSLPPPMEEEESSDESDSEVEFDGDQPPVPLGTFRRKPFTKPKKKAIRRKGSSTTVDAESFKKAAALARKKREEARTPTFAELKAILGEDFASPSSSAGWVRRSVRQPSKSELQSPKLRALLDKLRHNDSDMVVLKMKKYVNDPDAPEVVIEAALCALEENTNCQALYIQVSNILYLRTHYLCSR